MARNAAAPSRMEILVLTALCRAPMHGYELKLELEYKHVEWWAKCEHGHLYATLARLERGKFIRPVARPSGRSTQRVFAITASGRKRVAAALEALGAAADATYFDVDMFLSGCHLLDRRRAMAILAQRRDAIAAKQVEATRLEAAMRPFVPAVGRLIIDHRVRYLRQEYEFLTTVIDMLGAERTWGPFLGDARIGDFIARTQVPLERE
jgi:DNA-binding PadR family transcriptional regulator